MFASQRLAGSDNTLSAASVAGQQQEVAVATVVVHVDHSVELEMMAAVPVVVLGILFEWTSLEELLNVDLHLVS